MPRFLSDIIRILYPDIVFQCTPPSRNPKSQHRRDNDAPITSINTLSGDLLLRIFYHSQPVPPDKDGDDDDDDDDDTLKASKWDSERWWYKLAHVCQKWRDLLLASAPHMGLSVVCSYGTPVADILAHSPSLPLIIDYADEHREVALEDEQGILCALRNRLQVRRIRLCMPASSLHRLVAAIDGEFPMLEYLNIKPLTDNNSGLSIPETFKAPQLRYFRLRNITYSPATFRSLLTNPPVQPAKQIGESEQGNSPQPWKSLKTCIHILDDDSLLCLFYLCRPSILDKEEFDNTKILQGGDWDRERWWYKLVQVCRRWRYLIFASASHLGLNLHCTYGTPVTNMLAHSPPLPLVIDYVDEDRDTTAEDRDAVLFALQHRDRVRRVRVLMSVSQLQTLMTAFDNEFPMLEYVYIEPPTKHKSGLILPNGFRAPQLRHLILLTFAFPIRSPLLMAVVNLVTLSIQYIHPSTNCCPEDFFQQLTLLPQLETLGISFSAVFTQRDVDTHLFRGPLITDLNLPNLRWLGFRGISTYLEALLPRMTTPRLEKLQLMFFDQPDVTIPRLLQLVIAKKNVRFCSARFRFSNNFVFVYVGPCEGASIYTFRVHVGIPCTSLGEQVASAAQIFLQLGTMFSAIEHLTLEFRRSSLFSEMGEEDEIIPWGDLFRQFNNVKTLHLDNEFVRPVSRSLRIDGGESAMELLPELKVLEHPACRDIENSFNGFINARKYAGHPVTVVHV